VAGFLKACRGGPENLERPVCQDGVDVGSVVSRVAAMLGAGNAQQALGGKPLNRSIDDIPVDIGGALVGQGVVKGPRNRERFQKVSQDSGYGYVEFVEVVHPGILPART